MVYQSLTSPAKLSSYLLELGNHQFSGEVVLRSGEASAKLYLNDGLVIWAFATDQIESFQSILLDELKIPKEALLKGIKESREAGVRGLDAILQRLGIKNDRERTRIVERHTRSAIKTILRWTTCQAENSPKELDEHGARGFRLQDLLPVGAGKGAAKERKKKRSLAGESDDLVSLIHSLKNKLDSVIGAAIIDGRNGTPIASLVDSATLNIEALSAYYRELVRTAKKAVSESRKGETVAPLLEIKITTAKDTAFLFTLNNCKQILCLLLEGTQDSEELRLIVEKDRKKIEELLC